MGFEVDYAIYLEAKETVDDRALSPAVFESLSEWLVEYSKRSPVLKLLEVGGGVGTMASRVRPMRRNRTERPHFEANILSSKYFVDILHIRKRIIR